MECCPQARLATTSGDDLTGAKAAVLWVTKPYVYRHDELVDRSDGLVHRREGAEPTMDTLQASTVELALRPDIGLSDSFAWVSSDLTKSQRAKSVSQNQASSERVRRSTDKIRLHPYI